MPPNNHDYYRILEVPRDATLGLAIAIGWEYPYFGEQLTRTLVPVYPVSMAGDEPWMEEQGIEYVLLETEYFSPTVTPSYWNEIDRASGFILYRIDP